MKHKVFTFLRVAILIATAWADIYICAWRLFLKPLFAIYNACIYGHVTVLMVILLFVKIFLAMIFAGVFTWSGYVVQEIIRIYGE